MRSQSLVIVGWFDISSLMPVRLVSVSEVYLFLPSQSLQIEWLCKYSKKFSESVEFTYVSQL